MTFSPEVALSIPRLFPKCKGYQKKIFINYGAVSFLRQPRRDLRDYPLTSRIAVPTATSPPLKIGLTALYSSVLQIIMGVVSR